jgi:DNA-binding SARP family transcriptional activator
MRPVGTAQVSGAGPAGAGRPRYRALGPLRVRGLDGWVAVGPAKQRALLAVLLLRANQVVPAEQLMAELWGAHRPATAAKVVQVYVSKLRRLLDDAGAALQTSPPGYRLVVRPGELDAHEFDRLAAEGRALLASGAAADAAERLGAALALWRGAPLADVPATPLVESEAARLAAHRLVTVGIRVDAELAAGGHVELLPRLEALVREHPLHEGLRGQLMVALYRAGRQADALAAYRDLRGRLVDELGVEPCPELQRVERQILTADPALSPRRQPRDGQPPAPAGPSPAAAAPGSPAEVALRLRGALLGLAELRDHAAGARDAARGAIRAAKHAGDLAAARDAQRALAAADGRWRRYEEAVERCEQALALTEGLAGPTAAGVTPAGAAGPR